jgi:thymidylate synthase
MIVALVAYSSNYVISNKGKIPWHISDDMKRFKKHTADKSTRSIMLVGPKTYDTLPDEMTEDKERHIMVVRKNDISDIDNIIGLFKRIYDVIFIIGGEWLYKIFFKYMDIIMATRIKGNYVGDRFFPVIDLSFWKIIEMITKSSDDFSVEYEYIVYKRIRQEYQYLKHVNDILNSRLEPRNGTLSKFGISMKFDLSDGVLPLLTTKKMYIDGIVLELLWFISGKTDVNILRKKGIHIWDHDTSRKNQDKLGLSHYSDWDPGPIYGFNFRHYGAKYKGSDKEYEGKGIDQLYDVIKALSDPKKRYSRRHIISLWNPCQMKEVVLPACHMIYQFHVSSDNRLSCTMYQRSGDMGLGVPFNITSASLLTHIIGHLTGLTPHYFIHTIGDAHVYTAHIATLSKQIKRKPYKFPTVSIDDRVTDINKLSYDNITINDYTSHDKLNMKFIISNG